MRIGKNKTMNLSAIRKKAIYFCNMNGVSFSNSSPPTKEIYEQVATLKELEHGLSQKRVNIELNRLFSGNPSPPKKIKKVPSQSFYATDEWRNLRYKVLVEFGGACQCCGRSSKKHGVIIHVDHIKPRSLFPELSLVRSNLQIMCEDCNMGKSNKDCTDWRPTTIINRRVRSKL